MDYQIAISPELQVSADEFVDAWNETPTCRETARAEHIQEPPKGFPLSPELIQSGLIFLGSFAGSIALDIVKDLIKDNVKDIIEKKFPKQEKPAFEVLVIEGSDAPVIVVKEKE